MPVVFITVLAVAHARAGAAVGVTHQYAPNLVHGDVVEVEQVTTWVAAALVPNATALNGVGRCRVRGGPGATAVVGERDIQMPDAQEIGRLRVARCWSSQECISRTVVMSRDDFGELRILNPEWRARVFGLRPVLAAVMGDGDFCVPISIDVAEIDGVVIARRNGRVAPWTDALGVGYGPHDPTQAVVRGDSHSWPAHVVHVKAMLIRDVDRAVG